MKESNFLAWFYLGGPPPFAQMLLAFKWWFNHFKQSCILFSCFIKLASMCSSISLSTVDYSECARETYKMQRLGDAVEAGWCNEQPACPGPLQANYWLSTSVLSSIQWIYSYPIIRFFWRLRGKIYLFIRTMSYAEY